MAPEREEERPTIIKDAPPEEHIEGTDTEHRLHESPEGQVNRPDQPGVDEEERNQFNDPPVEQAGPPS